MLKIALNRLLVIASLSALVLGACVDDPGFVETGGDVREPNGGRDTSPDDVDLDENDGEEDDGDVELPSGTELQVEGPIGITIAPNERGSIAVKLFNFEGDDIEPLEDVVIRFQVPTEQVELMNGARPARQEARTDEDGIARVELSASNGAAQFQVVASVRGNEDIEPVTFSVRVGHKTTVDYEFIPVYEGLRMDVEEATIHLFETANGRCSDIVFDPFVMLQGESPLEVNTGRSAFDPTRFDSYFYTIDQSQGDYLPIYVAAVSGIRNGNTVLYGCVDGIEEFELGTETQIFIEMLDLFPSVAGVYNIRSDFDLPGLLPPALANILDIIEQLIRSPGRYLAELIIQQDSQLSGLIGDIIDALIFDVLLPDSWSEGRDQVTDVFDLLHKLPVSGTMRIVNEADFTGYLGEQNILDFNSIDIPGVNPFSGERSLIDGTFSATMVIQPGSGYDVALAVEQGLLRFRIGLILQEFLENMILPAMLSRPGQRVTIDNLARELIDCEALVEDIDSGFLESLLRSACDGAVTYLVDMLQGFLDDLNVSPAESFLLGTPADEPCPLYDNSPVENFSIDEMGRRTPYSQRCYWEGRVQWNPNDPVQAMPGRWAAGNRRPL